MGRELRIVPENPIAEFKIRRVDAMVITVAVSDAKGKAAKE
jgi:hypothetical protein